MSATFPSFRVWVGGKGIFVRHRPIRTDDGEVTPVHQPGILAISQGYPIEITVGVGFYAFGTLREQRFQSTVSR